MSFSFASSKRKLVPVERIELPTNGLQNRCSTAELNRLIPYLSGICRNLQIEHFSNSALTWPNAQLLRHEADLFGGCFVALLRPLSVDLQQNARVVAEPFCDHVNRHALIQQPGS